MLIYVCSSSHGFGHAARDAAVLQHLRQLRPEWTLVISSAVPEPFLRLLLGDPSVLRRPCRWDVGMVQADALGVDRPATLLALETLADSLPSLVEQEAVWISAQSEAVLIVGDVPPAAAALARRLAAPLVWMGNFGWDDIYRPLGSAFGAWCDLATEAYQQGELLLRCPFDLPMQWGLPEQRLGLVCSTPRPLPLLLDQQLQALDQPLVQVGFGGLGLELDSSLFELWPDHHFVLPCSGHGDQPASLKACRNVTLLPAELRPLDLLPFCSRHLGKPGFSTFCEVMAQNVGLHVVEREGFAEAEALMQGLCRHGSSRRLSRDQLDCGDWELDQPLLSPRTAPLASSGAFDAATALIQLAEGGIHSDS